MHDELVARGIKAKVHGMVASLRSWLAGANDPRMTAFDAGTVDRVTSQLCEDAGLTKPKPHPWAGKGGARNRKKVSRKQQTAE